MWAWESFLKPWYEFIQCRPFMKFFTQILRKIWSLSKHKYGSNSFDMYKRNKESKRDWVFITNCRFFFEPINYYIYNSQFFNPKAWNNLRGCIIIISLYQLHNSRSWGNFIPTFPFLFNNVNTTFVENNQNYSFCTNLYIIKFL